MKPALSLFSVLLLFFPLFIQAQDSSLVVDNSSFPFTAEFRLPIIYQSTGRGNAPISTGIDFFRYHGTKLHDRQHPNRFSEEDIGAISSFHIGAKYQPDPELDVANRGITGIVEGMRIIGSNLALGALVLYSRTTLDGTDSHGSELEIGPQIGIWSDNNLYINEKLSFRSISVVTDSAPGVRVTQGNFFQLRHHLAYVPSEDWSFTYAQDLSLRIGTILKPHVDNVNQRNYFVFSFSPHCSLQPMIGVNLDYFTGTSTSVLTIPLGLSLEYTINGAIVIDGGIEYDTPTMTEQPSDHFSIVGGIAYRL